MIPVLESAETPIQRLLDTVGHGDNPEADNGFCKQETSNLYNDKTDKVVNKSVLTYFLKMRFEKLFKRCHQFCAC